MPIKAGSLNATLTSPQMDLPFLITVARSSMSAGPGIQPKRVWTILSAKLACNALPIKDDLYFQESGAQNVSDIVFHFYAYTDIRVNDRVQFFKIDSIVGPPDAWFEIQQRFAPHQSLQYIRAFGRIEDAPQ